MNPNLFQIFYFKLLLWHTKISEFKLINIYLYIYSEQYCGQELVHALNCSNYPDASGKLRLMHMLHKLSRSHLWQIFPRRFYPWMFSISDTNPWMFPSSDTNASFVQSLLSVILSCLFSLVFTVMALSGQSLSVDIYLCPKYTNVYLILYVYYMYRLIQVHF